MYDAALGMGRDARNIRPIRNYEVVYAGNLPGDTVMTLVDDVALSADPQLALYVIVSIRTTDAQNPPNPTLELKISGEIVARYVIPTGAAAQVVFEVVALARELFPNPGMMELYLNSGAVGQTAGVSVKCSLFTTSI